MTLHPIHSTAARALRDLPRKVFRPTAAALLTCLVAGTAAAHARSELRCDFNGDGYEDLAVGAPYEDLLEKQAGMVHLFLGTPDGLSDTSQDISETPAFSDETQVTDGWFGFALACGDFDGNGTADLAIGRPGASFETQGRVYALYWNDSKQELEYGNSFPGFSPKPWRIEKFGYSLAAGDLNADGFTDLVVSAPTANSGTDVNEGFVYVHWGSYDGLGDHYLTMLHAVIPPAYERRLGERLTIGDFNGDGFGDIAMTAYTLDIVLGAEAPQIVVVPGNGSGFPSGPDLSESYILTGDVTLDGDDHSHPFTVTRHSVAEDFNGDGYDDLVTTLDAEGVLGFYPGSKEGLGKEPAAVLHREEVPFSGALVWDADLQDIYIETEGCYQQTEHRFAAWIPAFDDVEPGDHLIGDADQVEIYCDNGGPYPIADLGQQILRIDEAGDGSVTLVMATDEGLSEDLLGHSMAAADYTGDGRPDLVLGIPRHDAGLGEEDAGIVQVWPTDAATGLPNPEEAFSIDFGLPLKGTKFGAALAPGDFNGDGAYDLVVGSPGYLDAAGAVVVFHGGGKVPLTVETALTQLNGTSPQEDEDSFGFGLVGPGHFHDLF